MSTLSALSWLICKTSQSSDTPSALRWIIGEAKCIINTESWKQRCCTVRVALDSVMYRVLRFAYWCWQVRDLQSTCASVQQTTNNLKKLGYPTGPPFCWLFSWSQSLVHAIATHRFFFLLLTAAVSRASKWGARMQEKGESLNTQTPVIEFTVATTSCHKRDRKAKIE